MKKVLQPLMILALAIPGLAFANEPSKTTAANVAVVKDDNITVMSPRTGIRYTFANPQQRQVILKTAAITPANAANANRIVASNPALSAASQEKAKQALLSEAGQLASN
jgi:predicted aldo/keto reductase-like oxidoreductase